MAGKTLKRRQSKVNFKEELVDGVSKPMTNTQHWKLYYFENHAVKCPQCNNPWRVYRQSGSLCREGLEKAYEVSELLFKIKSDGNIYCKDHQEHQYHRIEVPKSYENVYKLL